jgi:crotonobetainyl-CoA:carnitine CoA-transferase CaiB-like acyl-CoA transferase
MMTAIYAVGGILAALLHRSHSDEGQYIDLALLDVQVAAMINIAQAYLSAGIVACRNGNAHPSVVPSQVFDCADGQLMLAAGNDGQFAKLCEVAGRPEVARDPRFATNEGRVRNRELVIATLEKVMRGRPVAYWTEKLAAAGVPCGPINDISAVFADAQVRHRGMRVEMQHPLAGAMALVGSPLRLSETPVEYRLPPPLLGQHTDEVLAGLLDMDKAEIERLRRETVI